MRAYWISLVLLAGVALFAAGLVGRWYLFERPLPFKSDRVELRVPAGSSVRSIAQAAQAAGIEVNADAMVAAARFTGTAQSLRAGRYAVDRGITLAGLLAKLQAGDVIRERLTVVEGIAFRELRALLAAQTQLKQDSARMSSRGTAEGDRRQRDASRRIVRTGNLRLRPWHVGSRHLSAGLPRADETVAGCVGGSQSRDLPYTSPYEALTMASIIEKETGQASERAMIAGVFVNRLRQGMLLQTDPSVIYGIGPSFDGNLRKRDLLADGPYNSYTRAGLPPTPIALPGRASIEAALNPANTSALYFVSRGDGTSHFSATLAEHNRAVDTYQRCCRR